MVVGDSMLKMDGSTVTAAVVADPVPPAPMQDRLYVTMPVPAGATVIDPLVGWLPLNAPPMSLEADAEQDVASLDVQASFTACPR
ncbi:MAG TPA: hypothetical protein VFX20_10380 [Steroidobacteraceae bacterium]|nr:hypothetical protein [Steroidobacteraceae bacterium]